jgi:hypothetical protein
VSCNCELNPAIRMLSLPEGGKSVRNKSHVCDDWVDVPLCMLTLSGMCAARLLAHGTVAEEKLIVHPESRIALSSVVAKVNAN